MAEIPVEKKSGMGWLWILLGLLVLMVLAWLLLASGDDDDVEYVDDDIVATDTLDNDAAMMASAGTYAIGESVDLDGIRVTSLAGDMAFNAEVNGEPMLVLFNQEPTPGDPTEGEYDINPGSIVNITGSVRSAADGVPANVDAQIPAGTDRYIFADTIEMAD